MKQTQENQQLLRQLLREYGRRLDTLIFMKENFDEAKYGPNPTINRAQERLDEIGQKMGILISSE